jgi:GT2 family glycosyltransferase
MKNLKIEIVMPVHNRRKTTVQCLKSLERIDKTGLEIHIIVVDDGSTDGTTEAIQKMFPEIEIISGDGTLFYVGGTNRGISAALKRNPDYILTVVDDSIFHEQFLQRLIKTAETKAHSVVGTLLLLWDLPHKVFQVDFKWKTLDGGWSQPENVTAFDFPQTAFEVEGMAGNCILFPVDAIKECGLLDEKKFPHNWGDIQYVVRMKKLGWQLLVEPKSYVWCEPNTNAKPLHQSSALEIFYNLFRNKHHPMNLKRQFLMRWDSAPTKTDGLLSFIVYLMSLTSKTLTVIKKG